MTLEKQILEKLRAARLHDPALRDEDRERRSHLGHLPSLVPLWPLVVIARHAGEGRIDAALAAVGVYLTATSLVRGGAIRQQLRSGPDVAAFAALPASDEWLADRVFRAAAREALVVMLPILVAGWLALPPGSTIWQWAAWAAAGLIGPALVAALATACAVVPVLARWSSFGFVLHVALFVTAYFPLSLPDELPGIAWFLIGLTPGGWIAQILRHAGGQSDAAALVWFAPVVAVACALPALRSRLARHHAVAEIVVLGQQTHVARFEGEHLDDMPTLIAGAEPAAESTAEPDAEPLAADPKVAAEGKAPAPPVTHEHIARILEAGAPRDRGPIDRMVWRMLGEREAHVIEWLMGRRARFTGEWRAILVACSVVAVGSFVVLGDLIPIVAIAVPLILGVALFTWSGFESRRSGGQLSPLHAPYPISYAEAARAMLKVNAVRLLVAGPAVLIAGTIAGRNAGLTPLEAAALAGKLWLMLVAAQPLLVAGAFMGGASDRLGFRSVIATPFVIVAAIAWLTSGIAWLMAEGAEGWLAFAAFAAIPLVVLVVYGWLYNRGHVDLLRTPR